jgi:hypothetical protein
MLQKKKKKKKIPDKKTKKNKFEKKPKNKPSGKKKYFFGKIAKIFLAGSATLSILYLVVGFSAGSGILKNDLKEKYGRVLGAVNVSVLIKGIPMKPTVTGVSGCSSSYPYIDLNWDDDLSVDTYDVWRDGNLLVSGLTASNYRDNNVNLATTYVYSVVATGLFGTAQSDEITVETEAVCYVPTPEPPPPPPPPANLVITRLDIIDLTNFRCAATTNKTKPTFSGTTNMAGARIAVEIDSGRKIRKVFSTFWANSNGYWSWKSKGKLKKGTKVVYFTAYDPNDASRFASASLRFKVGKKPSKKTLKKCQITSLVSSKFRGSSSLFVSSQMSLRIENNQKIVHQGEEVRFSLSDLSIFQPATNLQTGILDSQGNIISKENGSAGDKIKIDENLPAGDYKIFAQYISENSDVSAEDGFKIKEKPLLVLSSGYEITYRQLLSNLGWAVLLSLGVLGIFLLLLLLEHHLSKKALFQVTETDLKGGGMID